MLLIPYVLLTYDSGQWHFGCLSDPECIAFITLVRVSAAFLLCADRLCFVTRLLLV